MNFQSCSKTDIIWKSFPEMPAYLLKEKAGFMAPGKIMFENVTRRRYELVKRIFTKSRKSTRRSLFIELWKMDRLKTITYDYCCQSWGELEARALASKPGQRRLNYTARISIDAVAYDCWGFLKHGWRHDGSEEIIPDLVKRWPQILHSKGFSPWIKITEWTEEE